MIMNVSSSVSSSSVHVMKMKKKNVNGTFPFCIESVVVNVYFYGVLVCIGQDGLCFTAELFFFRYCKNLCAIC